MLDTLEEAVLRTFLLGAIVQLGIWLFRIKKPQLLLIAWTVVLAASLAMPALQWATPLRLPIIPALSSAILVEAAPPWRQPAATQASDLALSADIDQPPARPLSLAAVYFLIVGAFLLRLVVGVALSLRLLGKAVPVRMDWAAGTHVRISPEVTAPVTVGNVILLPADAMGWPSTMRQAVMAHERAHVARWDFAMLLASQVNRAVFWFSPLSWWLHRRLAALAELSSDDEAMAVTGDRPGYAEVLLEMGRRSGPLLRGLAMARPATLHYRIERILSDGARTTPVSPIQQVMLAIGAAGLSIAAASSQPNSGAPLDFTARAGQREPPVSADFLPSPQTQAMKAMPDLMPVPPSRAEIASQAPPQQPPAVQAATPLSPPVFRSAVRPIPRPRTRNALFALPARSMGQGIRRVKDQGAQQAPLRTAEVIASEAAAPNQWPASAPPLLKRVNGPSCTGVYLPRPGAPPADGSLNLIQANYFREADGTAWVKFFVGERTRAMLTGREVERTSIRTTVLTMLPRGTDHLRGTTHGPYGTIDFECGGSNAHL